MQRNSSSRSNGSGGLGKGKGREDGASRANYIPSGTVDLNDPDANFFHTSHQLEDWGSDDDDEVRSPLYGDISLATRSPVIPVKAMVADALREATNGVPLKADQEQTITPAGDLGRMGVGQPKSIILAVPPSSLSAPGSPEAKERLEWQTMLASVLGGEILKGESSRIGVERPSNETFRRELGENMWWQIRARMRSRTAEEEKRRVEERRGRVVDTVLEEVDRFVVKKPNSEGVLRRLSAEDTANPGESDTTESTPESELSALDQVAFMLTKLSLVESLYPHHLALRRDKPLYDSDQFQARVNAMSAWSTVVTSLQAQLHLLQKWTGSDDLDITRPNTTKERALVNKPRYHPLDGKAKARAENLNEQNADDSTFVERVLKEDNLQKTFERRAFVDILSLIYNAKDTVIAHRPMFEELHLPDFTYELVRLIGFPGRLIIEALRIRLNAAAKLVDPNMMVIDDFIDNFRLSISLAVLIKKQYDEITAPDPDERWKIPPCLAPNYNAVLLDGLRTFFRLLHWKLKSGSKAIYFRETEVLEEEWEFLVEAAEAVEGGDLVVAELFWYVPRLKQY